MIAFKLNDLFDLIYYVEMQGKHITIRSNSISNVNAFEIEITDGQNTILRRISRDDNMRPFIKKIIDEIIYKLNKKQKEATTCQN